MNGILSSGTVQRQHLNIPDEVSEVQPRPRVQSYPSLSSPLPRSHSCTFPLLLLPAQPTLSTQTTYSPPYVIVLEVFVVIDTAAIRSP